MSRLLDGAHLTVDADGAAGDVAAELLADLGASVRRAGDRAPAAVVTGAARDWPGVAGGAVEVATGYAAATAAVLAAWTGRSLLVDRERIAAWVLAPAVVAERWPPAREPVAVGEGAVAADLGAPGDDELFATLRATLDDAVRSDAHMLAEAAQKWRLPVTPFGAARPARRRQAPVVRTGPARARRATVAPAGATCSSRPLAGVVVCDLTAMWAGPLATRLLAMLGAEVVKIDSSARPDGLRFWGAERGGPPSPLYSALNAGKRIVDLDLRTRGGLATAHALIDRADVVVESFSRRVMPSFGLSSRTLAQRWPDVLVAALRAFPPGERADWVAYGPGVHAAAGLGDLGASAAVGEGRFAPPGISYPDPLGGFMLCAAIVAQIVGRARFGRVVATEVSLWDAVAPLWRFAQPGPLTVLPDATDRERLRGRFGPAFTLVGEGAAA
jgi:hypothetical protein